MTCEHEPVYEFIELRASFPCEIIVPCRHCGEPIVITAGPLRPEPRLRLIEGEKA